MTGVADRTCQLVFYVVCRSVKGDQFVEMCYSKMNMLFSFLSFCAWRKLAWASEEGVIETKSEFVEREREPCFGAAVC